MLTSARTRTAWLLSMLTAMSALAVLAAVLLRQALAMGLGEALMLGWILAPSIGLPLLLLVLPVLAELRRRRHAAAVIPLTGEKVP